MQPIHVALEFNTNALALASRWNGQEIEVPTGDPSKITLLLAIHAKPVPIPIARFRLKKGGTTKADEQCLMSPTSSAIPQPSFAA